MADFGAESGSLSAEEVSAVKALLTLGPSGGIGVTDDLKYCCEYATFPLDRRTDFELVKYSRQNSVHVSPTVLWDGLIQAEVSSSWGQQEWEAFLEKRISAQASGGRL